MELMTMDASMQPNKLVENYQSLIWTERYSTNGDFELKSTDIANAVNLLPLESFVCLRESTVPMVVEVHRIDKDKSGSAMITITGRSFETVLERRASVRELVSNTIRSPWIIPACKPSDAAYRAMRTVLGDSAQYQGGQMVLDLRNPAVSPNDAIPELMLTLPADYETPNWSATVSYSPGNVVGFPTGAGAGIYVATTITPNLNKSPDTNPTYWTKLSSPVSTYAASTNFEIKPQNLYQTVLELIQTNYRGLKATRPMPGNNQVSLEIYNGANLTNLVQFDARFDQFDSATYLLSEQGSADVAYVYGSNGASSVLKTAAPEPSGLARRVLVLDQTGDATVSTSDVRTSRGLIELYKNNATTLYDGQISTQVAAGYNRDYFLGDILQLVGEYGTYENVRVAEFIRTSDNTGEKSYPTFEAIV